MAAYYNEFDPNAAAWLRNLIAAGHIAPGVVDERSIEDVTPKDLHGFTQCHFFAGVGVWSLALRSAGWPDDRAVWTGSCPCQPFSAAGKGVGFADERHLWPAFNHLIGERLPPVVFGEQVASKDADPWIDLVHADLEALDYAFGAVPFPSASVGAPHIRDRLYWVADTADIGLDRRRPSEAGHGRDTAWVEPERLHDAGGLGHTERFGSGRDTGAGTGTQSGTGMWSVGDSSGSPGAAVRLANADSTQPWITGNDRSKESTGVQPGADLNGRSALSAERPGPTNGHWRAADWLLCRDGKWRPVEPGTFPLAHGAAGRVGRLRAYGNAINAIQAQVFIEAYLGR